MDSKLEEAPYTNQEVIAREKRISAEFESLQAVKQMKFDPSVKRFILSKCKSYDGYTCFLDDDDCVYRKLLFSALYTAAYRYWHTDDFSVNKKEDACRLYKPFLLFLNDYEFNNENRVAILKEFETSRVKGGVTKAQHSGMNIIIKCIRDALDYEPFFSLLNDNEIRFLYTLTETKSAPSDETSSYTLTQWFAQHTWLRRDDVGVGHELFARLASPKALINSFRITIETMLLEIQRAKKDLMSLLESTSLTSDDVALFRERREDEIRAEYSRLKAKHTVDILNRIREALHDVMPTSDELDLSIKLIIYELVLPNNFEYVIEKFLSNSKINYSRRNKEKRCQIAANQNHSAFFGLEFLYSLMRYLSLDTRENSPVPVCYAEHYLFSSLMAIQTVQVSDIGKLTLRDFSFVKRRNGDVTHIHCEYFKGRAKTIHPVKSLETKTDMGLSILQFIQDRSDPRNTTLPLTIHPRSFKVNGSGVLKRLFRFADLEFRASIERNINKSEQTTVFLNSLITLFENGEAYSSKRHKSVANYEEVVPFKSATNFWGLSAIKTSSIHANSDNFSPTQLINWHSHTNKTECESYRTPANLEWLNKCGLITRSVMQDLTTNLFRASDQEKQEFFSEFTEISESISSKSQDILSRMKLITGQEHGFVNELGFTKPTTLGQEDYLDTLYLLDSGDTVLRLKHYLSEVKRKHSLLVQNAPVYLFNTVLPTTEWIEVLFAEKRFSNSSMSEGELLYRKYKADLPPLFANFIGAQR